MVVVVEVAEKASQHHCWLQLLLARNRGQAGGEASEGERVNRW